MLNNYDREGDIILQEGNPCKCDHDEATVIRQRGGRRETSFELADTFNSFWSVRRASHYKPAVQSYWWYHLRYSHLISKKLRSKTYEPQDVDKFTVNERGKLRYIRANKVNDRVVNNLLDLYVLRPATEPKLVYDNGASRKGFGTDHSRRRVEKHCHDAMINFGPTATIVLFDIKNFFGSIPIDDMLKQYRDIIYSDDVYAVLEKQVKKHNDGPVGLGLGSVISQNAGLYYLHRFDNYVKIVLSRKYYGRYMDDFYIICRDKEDAREIKIKVKHYIENETKLKLNEKKTRTSLLTNGFTYLKFQYRVSETGKVYKRQSGDTFKRERRKLKKFKNTKMTDADILQSYLSWRGSVASNPYNQPRLHKTDKLFKQLYPNLVKYVNF